MSPTKTRQRKKKADPFLSPRTLAIIEALAKKTPVRLIAKEHDICQQWIYVVKERHRARIAAVRKAAKDGSVVAQSVVQDQGAA